MHFCFSFISRFPHHYISYRSRLRFAKNYVIYQSRLCRLLRRFGRRYRDTNSPHWLSWHRIVSASICFWLLYFGASGFTTDSSVIACARSVVLPVFAATVANIVSKSLYGVMVAMKQLSFLAGLTAILVALNARCLKRTSLSSRFFTFPSSLRYVNASKSDAKKHAFLLLVVSPTAGSLHAQKARRMSDTLARLSLSARIERRRVRCESHICPILSPRTSLSERTTTLNRSRRRTHRPRKKKTPALCRCNESHHPGSAVDHLGRPPGEAHYFLERFRFVFRVRLSVVHRR